MEKERSPFQDFSLKHVPMVDRVIREFYDRKIAGLANPDLKEIYSSIMEYCLRPGKRLRPLLMINAYGGYSGKKPFSGIYSVAAALEIIHALFLIQDDIIDKADTRRGQPAMHRVAEVFRRKTTSRTIGSDMAIIYSDILFFNALELIREAALSPVIYRPFMDAFTDMHERTCHGQIYDILLSEPVSVEAVTTADVMDVSLNKTAYYTLYYPVILGHILSGKRSTSERGKILSGILPLGTAFQMRDDIIGVFDTKGNTGKSVDSDLHEGKMTLLITNTVKKLPPKDRKRFLKIFKKKRKSGKDLHYLRIAIKESGALASLIESKDELCTQSEKVISTMEMTPAGRKVLLDVSTLIREDVR